MVMNSLLKSMLMPASWKSFFHSLGKNSIQWVGSENFFVSSSVKPMSFMIWSCFGSCSLILCAAARMGLPVQCHAWGNNTLKPRMRLYRAKISTRIAE